MPTTSDRRVALPAGLEPLLTPRELAAYFQVSDWTVRQWRAAGLPVVLLPATGRRKEMARYDLQAVREWLAERKSLAAA